MIPAAERRYAHLMAYEKAINNIDDYFEYRNESAKDKKFVHKVLASLTMKLEKIYKEDKKDET